MKETNAVMPMPKVTDEVTDETSPQGEVRPAPRIQANGMLNLDTREAGGQRILVVITELYASGHNREHKEPWDPGLQGGEP